MTDWNNVLTQALRELQADATFTRGAILHNKVTEIASRSGLDFDRYLKETNQKFSSVLQEVDNIKIHKRPNTDMYVGLVGAQWPESVPEHFPRHRHGLRADIYEAFTRISDSDYWYLPDTDEFSKDIAPDDNRKRIAIPSATLDGLLDQRRSFAEESDARSELINAIERSPNPLAAFQSEISRLRLGQVWHDYKFQTLRKTIEEWAKQNKIEFSPQWIESQGAEGRSPSPQHLLAMFATYMTDDEVRSISVPFRAVESMYRSIGQPRQ